MSIMSTLSLSFLYSIADTFTLFSLFIAIQMDQVHGMVNIEFLCEGGAPV